MRGWHNIVGSALGEGDVWIFAYGSLLWDPGFAYVEARPATLHGYHRQFCIYSYVYRGTPERPGLVLGLDRGGSCRGRVYRVAAANAIEVLDYLEGRERVLYVYEPRLCKIRVDRQSIRAVCYVADRHHPQYSGRLEIEDAASIIRAGHGERGPNVDYLANTIGQLDALGVSDRGLKQLLAAVERGSG